MPPGDGSQSEVASFTDAWIETCGIAESCYLYRGSHLLQMRGLKLWHIDQKIKYNTSHLLQMRGLKPKNEHGYETLRKVASFTDAWIETYFRSREQYLKTSHLLQMRGLKQKERSNI